MASAAAVTFLLCLTPILGGKIIDGLPADNGEFPFAVGIYYVSEEGTHFCTGSIISDKWVLTAAHCLWGGTEFSIHLGVNSLTQTSTSGLILNSTEYISHPGNRVGNLVDDIGLISLPSAVSFNAKIQPIKLPKEALGADEETIAVGWGSTEDSPDELYRVSLTTISNEACKEIYGEFIKDNIVCVVGKGNQGICSGDSGGPLIRHTSGGEVVQVGVASFFSSAGCETRHPSGFTRTFEYVQWIRNVTGMTEDDSSGASALAVNIILHPQPSLFGF